MVRWLGLAGFSSGPFVVDRGDCSCDGVVEVVVDEEEVVDGCGSCVVDLALCFCESALDDRFGFALAVAETF